MSGDGLWMAEQPRPCHDHEAKSSTFFGESGQVDNCVKARRLQQHQRRPRVGPLLAHRMTTSLAHLSAQGTSILIGVCRPWYARRCNYSVERNIPQIQLVDGVGPYFGPPTQNRSINTLALQFYAIHFVALLSSHLFFKCLDPRDSAATCQCPTTFMIYQFFAIAYLIFVPV